MIKITNPLEAQIVTQRLWFPTRTEEPKKRARNTMSAIKPNELTDWLTGISIVLSVMP